MNTIVWFRRDLRLSDNPALAAAAARGTVVPIFVLDESPSASRWRPGAASRWWLHHSLAALASDLGRLDLFRGDPSELLPRIVSQTGARAVYWNRCYEPHAIARDKALKAALQARGIEVRSFNASLLHEPWEVKTRAGGPFKVFTPFWRAAASRSVAAPLAAPAITIDRASSAGDSLDDWDLLPRRPNWAAGWDALWRPGEAGAQARLDAFATVALADYASRRNRPAVTGTSRLSPHLHWGEISPRQIWARLTLAAEEEPSARAGANKFLSELGWREFAYHLLYHFPALPDRNWRAEFDAYPWRESADDLRAWQRGLTGYPFVDAGMRELWQTGWMHNRVRMAVASFLIKHLRIDWRLGEAWFWDTLVDADLANNATSWQWVAGSGADASPYFRIFNPVSQGQKFDPDGDYVRRWCPELARLPDKYLFAPFDAPDDVLDEAGVALGKSYPLPIVSHAAARAAALKGYDKVRAARD
jgi:deoxyribodipyrimidine photo-lyase